MLGLLAVTCVFFFLYGPVEVALPVLVARELHGSAGLLGLYWMVFCVGATLGGLGAGFLRHRPLWLLVVSIIVGWGAALLPLGLTDLVVPGLVGMAIGGLIYGPFTAISTALFQRFSPPHALSRVLATRSALTIPATALGILLGGPMVTAVGGRHTLLISALLTIAFGASVAVFLGLGYTSSNRRTSRFGATRRGAQFLAGGYDHRQESVIIRNRCGLDQGLQLCMALVLVPTMMSTVPPAAVRWAAVTVRPRSAPFTVVCSLTKSRRPPPRSTLNNRFALVDGWFLGRLGVSVATDRSVNET